MNIYQKSEVDIEAIRIKAKKFHELYAESMTMVNAVDCIISLAKGSDLCDEFFELADPYLSHLATRQEVTKIQALFISLFMEVSADRMKSSISDLAYHIGCNNVKLLGYKSEIDQLVRRSILHACKDDEQHINYFIPQDFFNSISGDQTYKRPSFVCKTNTEFFMKYFDITQLRQNNELSTELLFYDFKYLIEQNQHLSYVKNLRSYQLETAQELVLTHFCRYIVLSKKDVIDLRRIYFLIDNDHERFKLTESIRNGDSILIKKGLLEHAFCDGFSNEDEFSLSTSAKKKLLKGINIHLSFSNTDSMINHKNITPKTLYFDESVAIQLDRLSNLLSEKEYKLICKRLQENGMSKGFSCLFYGSPGTGKTESALQLARKSGRDIMQVNISEIKSKWVGESEKNIKAIFDRYRILARHTRHTPILLFNEADGIFGKRKERADGSVDKMENAIQNIILQEMETMNGILIATTNLEQNLDAAFERRFLYKIRFDKPSITQRASIWTSFIPHISHEQATHLATSYDFSGGQIENIARKYNIDCILYGEDTVDEKKITEFCHEETLSRRNIRKIGYCI